jgi:hypothetical protein
MNNTLDWLPLVFGVMSQSKVASPKDLLGRLFKDLSGIESEKKGKDERNPACVTLLRCMHSKLVKAG